MNGKCWQPSLLFFIHPKINYHDLGIQKYIKTWSDPLWRLLPALLGPRLSLPVLVTLVSFLLGHFVHTTIIVFVVLYSKISASSSRLHRKCNIWTSLEGLVCIQEWKTEKNNRMFREREKEHSWLEKSVVGCNWKIRSIMEHRWSCVKVRSWGVLFKLANVYFTIKNNNKSLRSFRKKSIIKNELSIEEES